MSKHGICDFHKHASEILATTVDVSEMLSKQATTEREKNMVIDKSLLFHFGEIQLKFHTIAQASFE